jgi:hypothetical protein
VSKGIFLIVDSFHVGIGLVGSIKREIPNLVGDKGAGRIPERGFFLPDCAHRPRTGNGRTSNVARRFSGKEECRRRFCPAVESDRIGLRMVDLPIAGRSIRAAHFLPASEQASGLT